MSMTTQTREFLDVLARVLLRCWLFGFALLLIWLGLLLFGGEAVYRLHSQLFGLSKHELNVIMYCWLGSFKILILTFFFFPWLAIRLVLRQPT
jgi:hypothetical protein